ncbi:baculoviral IAP repeat-containing protein 1e-like isoform X2 [Neocloeon triangulifer]|uniref:baculoviral IAP repeat-containing protein 1e-like isoform X2 n=1 Tax=Neocloeon triangulifer TaxID=2078957 RepID=UPI00286F1521|nr:baculoviral IAP repeat-containing protein 1e-like isoform X2 [Neocloeon triangulifer]
MQEESCSDLLDSSASDLGDLLQGAAVRKLVTAEKGFLFNIALHRFFTFPTNLEIDPQALADAGLFWDENSGTVKCHFCEFVIERDSVSNLKGKSRREILQMMPNCKLEQSDNIELDSAANYNYESHRLYSLLRKKDWEFVTPVDMAKAGFYYMGSKDKVRCHFCNLEVHAWEEGDVPLEEHKRWNLDCPFLKDPDSVANFRIGEEIIDKMSSDGAGSMSHVTTTPFTPDAASRMHRRDYRDESEDEDDSDISSVLVLLLLRIICQEIAPGEHPEYSSVASRLISFENWPKSQPPQVLARAGFYYTGCEDEVRCFYCSAALKDWDDEANPVARHANANPRCRFLVRRAFTELILNGVERH